MGKKLQVLVVLSPFGKLRHAVLGGSERTLCGRKAELWPIDVKGGEPSCAACRIGLIMHEKRQGLSRKKRRERLQRKQTGARARLTIIDEPQGLTVSGAPNIMGRIEELAREVRERPELLQGVPPEITDDVPPRLRETATGRLVDDRAELSRMALRHGQGRTVEEKARTFGQAHPELIQCKACPWKVSTVPGRDIPNGYCRAKHAALQSTIAKPGDVRGIFGGSLHMMACHESPVGAEKPCVGWLSNQLGPGNNLALRILASDGRFAHMKLDGDQHETLEDTL